MIEFARGQIQQAPWVQISDDAMDETLILNALTKITWMGLVGQS